MGDGGNISLEQNELEPWVEGERLHAWDARVGQGGQQSTLPFQELHSTLGVTEEGLEKSKCVPSCTTSK